MAEAVILVGLQGSGKTTFFKQNFARTHAHVSRDTVKTAAAETALVSACLKSGASFAIDDTNPTRQSRAAFIRAAKAAGFHAIAIFFDTPVRVAIGRNRHRTDKKPIPVPAILRAAKLLEKPSLEEGFDEVRVIAAK